MEFWHPSGDIRSERMEHFWAHKSWTAPHLNEIAIYVESISGYQTQLFFQVVFEPLFNRLVGKFRI